MHTAHYIMHAAHKIMDTVHYTMYQLGEVPDTSETEPTHLPLGEDTRY